MTRVYDFKNCVLTSERNYCRVEFPDGSFCVGTTGLGMEAQEQSARNMGYEITEEGLNKMLREHELGHILVSQALGFPYSIVHRLLSKFGQDVPQEFLDVCLAEESIVGALQTYVNTGELHAELEVIRDLPKLIRKYKYFKDGK